MNILDRMINAIAPRYGLKRHEARTRLALSSNVHHNVMGGGKTYTGASQKRGLKGWNTGTYDANSSMLDDLPVLRSRSRDLYQNSPIGRGVINTIGTNVVGAGLLMRSLPDAEVLGMTPEEAQEWGDNAERQFRMWASDKNNCDLQRRLTFAEIQNLAFNSKNIAGDVFVLMPYKKRINSRYDLKIQLIEAERVCNPNDMPDDEFIAGGIEYDEEGIPLAIHIRTPHPGSDIKYTIPTWERVEFYGSKSGRVNVIHLMEHVRIDQARGEILLAPVIETIKQISKYTEAELSAAVINAVLAVFVERAADTDETEGIDDEDEDGEKPWEVKKPEELGSGTWIDGAPGEKLTTVSANRPSSQFDPFFVANMKLIGMAVEIPFEVLLKHFSTSYTAARGALLEAWKKFRPQRQGFGHNFCQVIYEELITEAVTKGLMNAPGFLTDPDIRAAYLKSEWVGPTQGLLDPVKEAEGARKQINYGFTTNGSATAELTGQDWDEVIKTQARENKFLRKHNIVLETSVFQPVATEPLKDSDDDSGEE